MNTHYVGPHKQRFPRLEKEAELRALVAEGWAFYERGYKANVELGRVFRRIKKIVGHGNWERYYLQYFPNCVALRTARTYMHLARKEDAMLKTAESAVFKTGTSSIALEVKAATEKAKAEAGPKKLQISLSIPLEQQDAIRKLQRSLDWLKADRNHCCPDSIHTAERGARQCKSCGLILATKQRRTAWSATGSSLTHRMQNFGLIQTRPFSLTEQFESCFCVR